MPGCSAVNCSNTGAKGFLMRHFPTDPVRRKEWLVRMKRDKWTPTKYSCLCEVHFEPHMWEKDREDGKRKLKHNAVPTLFSFTKSKKIRKPPAKRVHQIIPDEVELDVNQEICIPSTSSALQESSGNSSSSPGPESIHSDCDKNLNALELKIKKYDQQYKKVLLKMKKYKTVIRQQKKVLNKTKNAELENTALLYSVFSQDQVTALKRKSMKFTKWTNGTVKRALQLKFSCGSNGYEELLKQKIPWPP